MNYLSDHQIETVLAAAYRHLGERGVRITHKSMRARLEHGCSRVDGDRVILPEELVREAVAQAPRTIPLYDSLGREHAALGGDSVLFAPGSAATWLYDHGARKNRRPLAADVVNLGKLVSGLGHVALNSTALVPYDEEIPAALRDAYRMYLALLTCTAPLVTGIFGPRYRWMSFGGIPSGISSLIRATCLISNPSSCFLKGPVSKG